MIKKKVLNRNRIRCTNGGFSFIPHRFLTDGFLAALDQHQLLLYFFLKKGTLLPSNLTVDTLTVPYHCQAIFVLSLCICRHFFHSALALKLFLSLYTLIRLPPDN